MDNKAKLRIEIRDFRAIRTADIVLNGITVLTGVNGCGKSTISKLVYRTLKTAIDFEKIIGENLFNDLNEIRRFLFELSREIEYLLRRNRLDREHKAINEIFPRQNLRSVFDYDANLSFKEQEERVFAAFDMLITNMKALPVELLLDEKNIPRFYRLERFAREDFFGEKDIATTGNIIDTVLKLREKAKLRFDKALSVIGRRPLKVLDDIIDSYFTEDISAENFEVKELGVSITDRSNKKLLDPLGIRRVIYTDTPMIVGIDNLELTNVEHWVDLINLLKHKGNLSTKSSKISDLFEREIIDGTARYDEKNDTFVYERNDGFRTDLFSCATGLKSFSLLQILFENGLLDSKTLLVIDEPETHLHPEWIPQYARLIILLHKELKVNFLIGSHNPDMVMAIRYIAKKELEESNDFVNFYLANTADRYHFDYHLLTDGIEPIFKSFNASLDKINEFGATED